MTKKIMQLSVAALCLCVSALAIVTLMEVRRMSAMTIDYISESVLYGAATMLEQTRALPRADAEKIKAESIENIAKRSDRWGKIIKAVNDTTARSMPR